MIDLTKPMQTRDGQKVNLITTEGREEYPLVGYVGDGIIPTAWTKEGKWWNGGGNFTLNLVNIPEDVYKDKAGWMFYFRKLLEK